MDKDKLSGFKAALIEEKARLQEMIDSINDTGLGIAAKDAIGELSSYDNHPADEGSNVAERERDVGTRADLAGLIKRVNDALERIEKGTYGVCEHCGGEIEEERLKIMPYVALCAGCAREQEISVPDRFNRPIEESALVSYDRHFMDGRTPGIDGEDIWQDVARYGTSNTPQDLGGPDDIGNSYIEGDELRGAAEETDLIIEGDEEGEEIPPLPDIYRHRHRLRSK
ncbi:MAG: conjugal transfer protein TraR [Firmicutes bacterium]|nr:conjugal transfer protein TraR [Bacillota bacterium]